MTTRIDRAAFARLQDYARRSQSFKPGEAIPGARSEEWSGVVFRLGDARLACNISRVQEILPLPAATPVPGAKPWVLGLANVRGALMTLIDLPGFLGGKPAKITPRSRLLATGPQKAPLGLLIDEVFGQRHFLESDASPPDLPENSPLRHIVGKQYPVGSESWQELSLEHLFNLAEFRDGAAE